MCMFFNSYHSLNFPAMTSLAVTYIPLYTSQHFYANPHDSWIVDITTLRWGTWIIWPALLLYPIICHYYTHKSKLNCTPCSMMSQPDWPPREVPCDGSRSGEPQKKTAEPYRIWIGFKGTSAGNGHIFSMVKTSQMQGGKLEMLALTNGI